MPSLVEEDPEYAVKVQAYLDKHGLKALPWGHIVAHGHMVAVSTYRERLAHALGVVLVVQPPVNLANALDAPVVIEPVTGQDGGDGAAAAGVEPANAG